MSCVGITVLGAVVAKCSDYLEVKRKQSGLKQNAVPTSCSDKMNNYSYLFIFRKGLEKGMVEFDTIIAYIY